MLTCRNCFEVVKLCPCIGAQTIKYVHYIHTSNMDIMCKFDWDSTASAVPITEEDELVCCPELYYCPTSKSIECYPHGGFDTCCANPSQHVHISFPGSNEESTLSLEILLE